MSLPLVSIVIRTAGKRNPWLDEAIASALGQSHRELEVVVVWDSPSKPPQGVLDWTTLHPRLRVYNTGRRAGLAVAANAGVAEARGELVGFLDDDDVLRSWHVERCVNALAPFGPGAVAYDDVVEVDADSENKPLAIRHTWDGGFTWEQLKRNNTRPNMAWLFPKVALELCPADPGDGPVSDWSQVLKIWGMGYPFRHVVGIGGEYRIRSGGNMVSDKETLHRKTEDVRARYA